jgi:putative transposase
MRDKRVQTPGATYFFTVNLANRESRLLTGHIDALRLSMRQAKQNHPFSIDALVILPDHLHTVWTLPENDSDDSKRWMLIKSTTPASFLPTNIAVNVGHRNAKEESGNEGFGSTALEMRKISCGILIIFISIR